MRLINADALLKRLEEKSGMNTPQWLVDVINEMPTSPRQKKRRGRDAYGRLIVDEWHLEVQEAELTDEDFPHIIRVGITGLDHKGAFFTQYLGKGFNNE